MSLDENISRLVDMGFDPQVAREALTATNNQLEAAINVIYPSEETEPPPSYNQELIPLANPEQEAADTSLGEFTNKPNIPPSKPQRPDLPQPTAPIHLDDDLRSKISQYGYDVHHDEHTDSRILIGSNSSASSHSSLDLQQAPYSIYDDIPRTVRVSSIPPLLLPDKPDLLEGYMAPLLMILSRIPKFRELILKHQFFNYGYAPNWWKSEQCLPNALVTQEIQRLVAFLSDDSKRSFATIGNLTNATSKISTDDYDTISEFILFVFKAVVDLFGKADSSLRKPLSDLFDTYIDSPMLSTENSYKSFTIEPSFFNTDIYRIMHSLMWDRDFSSIGLNKFTKVSDLLTFVFDNSGERVESDGFMLASEFYPQIYTEKYDHLIQEKVDLLESLKEESAKVTSEMLRLRSYKGKKVTGLLDSAVGYLKEQEDPEESSLSITSAITELSSLQSHIIETGKKDALRLEEISKERNSIDIFDVDYILGEEKSKLEPWILVGIIVSECQFSFLSKTGKWGCFFCEVEGTKNFEYDEITFEEIQEQVRKYSKEGFESGLTLLYVRKSVYLDDSKVEMNEKLREFIDKDNEQLEKELTKYTLSNPINSSAMEISGGDLDEVHQADKDNIPSDIVLTPDSSDEEMEGEDR